MSTLVFNEIFLLHFCALDKYTFIKIDERQRNEVLNSEGEKHDKSEGDYKPQKKNKRYNSKSRDSLDGDNCLFINE